MRKKIIIAVIGTVMLFCGGAQTGLCADFKYVKPSMVYKVFIDDFIEKCDAKAEFLDSSSLNIRKIAMRATAKGTYLERNRDKLIIYLMEKNVPLNPDRVKYHLNQKYLESVRPNEVYALLLNENNAQGVKLAQ